VPSTNRPGVLAADAVPKPASLSSYLFDWWRAGTPAARRAHLAASLGWMLDAFDVMLYAMVLPALMPDLALTKGTAGLLGSATLLAAAAGGLMFGVIADRYGRTRALMGSVLIYSIFTAACGFAHSAAQLAIFRILLGIGMGGEWASGAALVSETWPAEHRGKAMALMQSSWAIGYGAAAVVVGLLLPTIGWRGVFFVGVLPALLTLWIRRHVQEPEIWMQRQRGVAGREDAAEEPNRAGPRIGFSAIFGPELRTLTVALTAMNACCLFAWWGLNLWIPAYLALPAEQGGVGLAPSTMAGFVVAMQVGMWFGYVTFGYIADTLGRKRAYLFYLCCAAVLLPLYGIVRIPGALLALGPLVAFFGTGYYSGFGAVTAEIFPTAIRASAQGFCYNTGRILSAAAPFIVGSTADSSGFGLAFTITGAAFLVAAVCWIWIPETKGRVLS
jgi:MFS family permease